MEATQGSQRTARPEVPPAHSTVGLAEGPVTTEAVDVVIVGAGPAGLSAALVLGRMRRRVLVLDTDAPAGAVVGTVQGFLPTEGASPRELRRLARVQLQSYGTVEVRHAAARMAGRTADGDFEITLHTGARVTADRLLLAHGVRYDLDDVPGLAQVWGSQAFRSPYCHGWEVRDTALAVFGHGDAAVHHALLLATLSDDVVLIHSGMSLSVDQCRQLHAAHVDLRADALLRVERRGTGLRLVLRHGPDLLRDTLFVQPAMWLASDIAASLGVRRTRAGTIAVNANGRTSVAGLYAAGDAADALQSIAIASGSGARAAYAIHADLATRRIHRRVA
jgi:thioredoxin reductase